MSETSVDNLPTGRTRVLFVNHTAQLGGGEIALLNLVRHLDPSRVQPQVALLSDGPLTTALKSAGMKTRVLDAGDLVGVRKDTLGGGSLLKVKHALGAIRTTIRLARLIRAADVDVVHANSLKADLIAGVAGRLVGVPVIWHVRDRISDDYLPSRVAGLFRWLSHRLPRHVITNSQATLDTLRSPGDQADERRFTVVHDGTPVADEPAVAPMCVGEGPLVGLVGRISRWKGQDVFLRAAATVLERFPEATFQVIGGALFGEEAYEREVRALAESLGIAKQVWFAGFRDDVPHLIARLDVLVHASVVPEPFGQVVIEGMCAGKPVVATAGGGVLEIVQDGVTGRLVPMGEAGAMANAVVELLSDPVRATTMGDAGQRRVREHFSIELTASRVMGVYDRLLGERRSGVNANEPARESAEPDFEMTSPELVSRTA